MLPSLYVAASMPSNVETRILDEDVEPVDFNTHADLIGISFMTYNAPRAYEIADRFRKKGKTDIRIEFENRAAFVAECKLWKGEKKILEADTFSVAYEPGLNTYNGQTSVQFVLTDIQFD